MIRAVVDVNVIFSATIIARGMPYELLREWQHHPYTLVSPLGMISELDENLRDPKQAGRYQLTDQDVQAIVSLLRSHAELVSVPTQERVVITGDPEDDYVLA